MGSETMKAINPIIDSPRHTPEHPLEIPQYVQDSRQDTRQKSVIPSDEQINKSKALKRAKCTDKAKKKMNNLSLKRRRVSCKPFKGIINGISSNHRLKVNDTPGWNQESDKNILTIDQIMKFSEVDLKNFIEIAKFEADKEQLGNIGNTVKITLMYGLIELKKKELELIYNYIKQE